MLLGSVIDNQADAASTWDDTISSKDIPPSYSWWYGADWWHIQYQWKL